jgi:2-phosphosulfolactate phosphatase
MPSINAYFLPELAPLDALSSGHVVVIDVLRATTVIVQALASGARDVRPCLEVDEARSLAATLNAEEFVLGGEREGLPIPGFDLGNSPCDYTPQAVGSKTVVFTTTNGTKAMNRCQAAAAKPVLIAGFVNRAAIAGRLRSASRVHLVCSGTGGEITREDVLLAGALVNRISTDQDLTALNDQARLALDAWHHIGGESTDTNVLSAELQETRGGKNLVELGLAADIDGASQIDRFDLVPVLDVQAMRIVSG